MAEGKINGNLKINDGSTDYRTLKELNNLVTTLNNLVTTLNNKINILTPTCLFDYRGIEASNYGNTNGLYGRKISIY